MYKHLLIKTNVDEVRLSKLKETIRKFRDERDWKQFHNPKDLAVAISVEAAELLEHFQWKNGSEVDKKVKADKEKIEEEMADVYIYLLELSDIIDVDLIEAAKRKIAKNEIKYPADKAKGNAKKYTEL